MANDEPPFLTVGTEVSAKYKGAFCEAKIKKVQRSVKCRVSFKGMIGGSVVVPDEHIKGGLKVGNVVEAKHPDKPNSFQEGTIIKVLDQSQYTVYFDDGDVTTLRRSSLCLKGAKHYQDGESLDQLPLTNPEHFCAPVAPSSGKDVGSSSSSGSGSSATGESRSAGAQAREQLGKSGGPPQRKKRTAASLGEFLCREGGDASSQEEDDQESTSSTPRRKRNSNQVATVVAKESKPTTSGSKQPWLAPGAVIMVEIERRDEKAQRGSDTPRSKKEALAAPALVMRDQVAVKKDEIRIKFFKDGQMLTIPKKDAQEFDRMQTKLKGHPQKSALFKALVYLEKGDLPQGWNRKELLDEPEETEDEEDEDQGSVSADADEEDAEDAEEEIEADSDIEDGGERDRFVAQLYKFMEERGTPINKAPTMNGKDLDLHQLFTNVQKIGTFDKVTNLNKWKDIYAKMFKELKATSSQGQQLKSVYKRYLHGFEDLYRKLGITSNLTSKSTSGRSQRIMTRNKQPVNVFKGREKKAVTPQPESPSSAAKKEKDEDEKRSARSKKPESEEKRDGGSTPKRARSDSLEPVKKVKEKTATTPLPKNREELRRDVPPGLKKRRPSETEASDDELPNLKKGIEPIRLNDRIKVKYGHGKQQKVYEAKVLKVEDADGDIGEKKFFVHYTGWNNRYDEWILKKRILENITLKQDKGRHGSKKSSSASNSFISISDRRDEKDRASSPSSSSDTKSDKSTPVDQPPRDKLVADKEEKPCPPGVPSTSKRRDDDTSTEEPRKRRGKPPKKFDDGYEPSPSIKKEPKESPKDVPAKKDDDVRENVVIKEKKVVDVAKEEATAVEVAPDLASAPELPVKVKEEKKSSTPTAPEERAPAPVKKLVEVSPELTARVFAVKSKPPESSPPPVNLMLPAAVPAAEESMPPQKEPLEATDEEPKEEPVPEAVAKTDKVATTPKRSRTGKRKKTATPSTVEDVPPTPASKPKVAESTAVPVTVAPALPLAVAAVKAEQSEGEDTDIEKDLVVAPLPASIVAEPEKKATVAAKEEPDIAPVEVKETPLEDSTSENKSMNLDESGIEALEPDAPVSSVECTPTASAVPTSTSTPRLPTETPSPVASKTRKFRPRRISENKDVEEEKPPKEEKVLEEKKTTPATKSRTRKISEPQTPHEDEVQHTKKRPRRAETPVTAAKQPPTTVPPTSPIAKEEKIETGSQPDAELIGQESSNESLVPEREVEAKQESSGSESAPVAPPAPSGSAIVFESREPKTELTQYLSKKRRITQKLEDDAIPAPSTSLVVAKKSRIDDLRTEKDIKDEQQEDVSQESVETKISLGDFASRSQDDFDNLLAERAAAGQTLAELAQACSQKDPEHAGGLFLICEENVLPASPVPNCNNQDNADGEQLPGPADADGEPPGEHQEIPARVTAETPPTTPETSQSSSVASNQNEPKNAQGPRRSNGSHPDSQRNPDCPRPADEESTMSADSCDSNRANADRERDKSLRGKSSLSSCGSRGGHRMKRTRKTLRQKVSQRRAERGSPDQHGNQKEGRHSGLLCTQMPPNYDPARPSRFSYNAPIENIEDPEERIRIIQERLGELKSTYLNLKREVASIDRKRKKLRRREAAARAEGSATNSPRNHASPNRATNEE